MKELFFVQIQTLDFSKVVKKIETLLFRATFRYMSLNRTDCVVRRDVT